MKNKTTDIVLVVDDEATARMQIIKYLRMEFDHIIFYEAENGAEALQFLELYPIQVVLCDINMPELDGLSLLKRARQRFPRIEFVIFTGREDPAAPIRALKFGASDYLRKPLDMEEVVVALRRAFDRWTTSSKLDQYQKDLLHLLMERTERLESVDAELKKELEENQRLTAQLRQAQRLETMGMLANGVAHDFNNLLYIIMGHIRLVMDDLDPGSLTQHNLSKAIKTVQRAGQLTKRILAFSHPSSSDKKAIQASAIIDETTQLIRAALPTNIELIVDLQAHHAYIEADPIELHQVILNLCTNASQAMMDTGGILEIKLIECGKQTDQSHNDHENQLVLSVRDTGPGMTHDITQKIFDPFFTTKSNGSGIGLSIVKDIIEGLNGEIILDTTENLGTTFFIYLPLLEDPSLCTPIDTTPDNSLPGGDESILLVDDDEQVVAMCTQSLTRQGYNVTGFTDPKAAIDIFNRSPEAFDLCITAQSMPTMSGVDLAHILQQKRPELPVLLCTGFSHVVSPERSHVTGIYEYLETLVDPETLTKAIRHALDQESLLPSEKKNILVIDDEEDTRLMLRQLLERAGYNVLEAINGKVGIETLVHHQIDLILSDIFMPEKDGIEVIMDLNKSKQNIPIFCISGHDVIGTGDYLEIAEQLGAARTFLKPIQQQKLLSAIGQVLQGQQFPISPETVCVAN